MFKHVALKTKQEKGFEHALSMQAEHLAQPCPMQLKHSSNGVHIARTMRPAMEAG